MISIFTALCFAQLRSASLHLVYLYTGDLKYSAAYCYSCDEHGATNL